MPLGLSSERLILSGTISVRATALTRQWLAGFGYRPLSVDAETADGSAHLVVAGEGALPPPPA